jgi:8-oxo-dGTP pyrophosphatase MutT (NUDIX family)
MGGFMSDIVGYIRQAAALPVRNGKICIITSSNGKRWIIPKGLIEPGQSAGETALQEAWEEAGLVGTLQPDPLGSYLYEKLGNTYHVLVYALHVAEVSRDWPERDLRQRVWVNPDTALTRIDDVGLTDMLRQAFDKDVVFEPV